MGGYYQKGWVKLMFTLVLLMFRVLKAHRVNFKLSTVLKMDFLPPLHSLAASSNHHLLASEVIYSLSSTAVDVFRRPLAASQHCLPDVSAVSQPVASPRSSSTLVALSITLCRPPSTTLCHCTSLAATSLFSFWRSSFTSTIHRSRLRLQSYVRSTIMRQHLLHGL